MSMPMLLMYCRPAPDRELPPMYKDRLLFSAAPRQYFHDRMAAFGHWTGMEVGEAEALIQDWFEGAGHHVRFDVRCRTQAPVVGGPFLVLGSRDLVGRVSTWKRLRCSKTKPAFVGPCPVRL